VRLLERRLLASGGVARRAIGVAAGVGVASALLAVAQAALLARIIAGAFLGGEDLAALTTPLVVLAAVLAARSGLAWAAEVAAHRISGPVKSDLRSRLLDRAVHLGPRWAAESRSGEVTLLATRGLDALDGWFGRTLPQVALAAIVPIAVVICLALVDLVAALTVALTVPLIPVFMALVGRMSAAQRHRRWASLAILSHRFLDVVAGLPTLRAYGRADAQVAVLRRATDAWRTSTMATLRVAFLSALVLELLATISVALVAVGVGLRLDAGQLALETGLFAIILAPEAYLPLRRLGAEFHASEEGLAAARGAFEIIDAEPAALGASLAPPAHPCAIVVEDLWVTQPGRDLAAPAGASLRVRRGEIVAVTGPSGAGKSTLLAAVLGLVEPARGRVAVLGETGDVIDVRDLDRDAWHRVVAWVPQAPFLFAGSIADNVRLGRPAASDAEVRARLAAVGLAGVEPGMPLGERGAGLSSGQRRRVGIARALLRAAPVLLLDEPTAGLDAEAESAVLAAVRAAARTGTIVLLVAHRPAAAAAADRVATVQWAEIPPQRQAWSGSAEDPGPAGSDPVDPW
jgi:ATP-binding cassette, subfamily C, bacterial CydCD